MPSFELFQQSERGLVALAGCVVSGDDPDYACSTCRHYFYRDRSSYAGHSDPLSFHEHENADIS
jgi:hypothetical protein